MKFEIDLPEHQYNNIIALNSLSLGRVPYKGIIMYAINAIKNATPVDQEPNVRHCFGCKYSKDNHIAGTEECHLCMWENQYTAATKNDLSSELEKNSKKLEKDFGELDCIDRAELLKAMDTWDKFGYTETGCFVREPKGDYVPYVHYEDMVNCVKNMLSVAPQEPTTKNNLGVDCISREQALNEFYIYNPYDSIGVDKVRSYLKALPSVTPQTRKGHWVHGEYCSECGCDVPAYIIDWKWQKDMDAKYCPNCGAKMKSEDKE